MRLGSKLEIWIDMTLERILSSKLSQNHINLMVFHQFFTVNMYGSFQKLQYPHFWMLKTLENPSYFMDDLEIFGGTPI